MDPISFCFFLFLGFAFRSRIHFFELIFVYDCWLLLLLFFCIGCSTIPAPFVVLHHEACGSLAPRLGIQPVPPTVEGEVLTTGPQGCPPCPIFEGSQSLPAGSYGFFSSVEGRVHSKALRQEKAWEIWGTEQRTAHFPELILFKHPQVLRTRGQVWHQQDHMGCV